MKERPIIFSAPMIRAILEGRKTQTRRILKGSSKQPYLTPELLSQIPPPIIHGEWTQLLHPMAGKFHHGVQESKDSPLTCVRTPFQPGMRLWVRETWRGLPEHDESFEYRADWSAEEEGKYPTILPWKPSIFMPRWASRITLEVTDVRVERLQGISAEDARAEAACSRLVPDYIPSDRCGDYRFYFERIWESIHGPGSWEVNPWVFAISFRRIEEVQP